MPPFVAAVVCVLGILGLLVLDRDPERRTSPALWIAVIWMVLAGSRPISQWLQGTPVPSVDQNLDGNPFERNIYSVLLLIGLIVLFVRGRKASTLSLMNAPLLLFIGYCAVSVLWSDYPGVAFRRWIKALGDPVMIMIVLTDPDRLSALKRFFARTAFLLLPVSILLIKYYPALGVTFTAYEGIQRVSGVASDKNMLGAICLVGGMSAVWRIRHWVLKGEEPRGLRPLIPQAVILLMVIWLLWTANSMTSIGSLALGSGLIVATSFPNFARRKTLVHGFAAMAIAAACVPLFLDAAGGVLAAVGRDPTLTQRTELWSDVAVLNPSPLVGTGFESYWLGSRLTTLWAKYQWRPNESHNGYLEVYLNLGWVGLASLALVVVVGYRRAIGMLRLNPELGSLKVACLVVGLIYSLTEAAFRMLHPMWIFTMMAVFVVQDSSVAQRSSEEPVASKSTMMAVPRWGGPRIGQPVVSRSLVTRR